MCSGSLTASACAVPSCWVYLLLEHHGGPGTASLGHEALPLLVARQCAAVQLAPPAMVLLTADAQVKLRLETAGGLAPAGCYAWTGCLALGLLEHLQWGGSGHQQLWQD